MKHGIDRAAWFFLVWIAMLWPCFATPAPAATAGWQRVQDLLAAGVQSEATSLLIAYVEDHPDDYRARYTLATLLAGMDRHVEAVEHALAIPKDDRVYGAARRHLLLRIRLRMAGVLDWDDPEAVLTYARLCARMGSYERSARAYRWLLSRSPTPEHQREYAAMLMWGEQYRDAARVWTRYLESRPDDVDAWHRLARTEMAVGDLASAEQRLESVIERAFDPADAMLDLARVRIWLGEKESADRILMALQEADDPPDEAGILRAELLLRLDQVEAAYDHLRDVLDRTPEHRRAREMLEALETSRRIDIARLRRSIGEAPDDQGKRMRLIEILLEVDRPGAALRELKTLAGLRPDDVMVRERIAQIEARQQRDVSRMLQRLTATTGMDRDPETLESWLARHPDDRRAAGYLTRSLPLTRAIDPDAPPSQETP